MMNFVRLDKAQGKVFTGVKLRGDSMYLFWRSPSSRRDYYSVATSSGFDEIIISSEPYPHGANEHALRLGLCTPHEHARYVRERKLTREQINRADRYAQYLELKEEFGE